MKVKEDYIREVIREEIKKITENIPLPVENRTLTLDPAEKGVIIGIGEILHHASERLRQHIDGKGDDPVHEGIRALNDAVSTAIEVQNFAESGTLPKETEENKNSTKVKDTDLMIIATAIHQAPSSDLKDEALGILNRYLKTSLHENIMNESFENAALAMGKLETFLMGILEDADMKKAGELLDELSREIKEARLTRPTSGMGYKPGEKITLQKSGAPITMRPTRVISQKYVEEGKENE